jgi:hypothetical protein
MINSRLTHRRPLDETSIATESDETQAQTVYAALNQAIDAAVRDRRSHTITLLLAAKSAAVREHDRKSV